MYYRKNTWNKLSSYKCPTTCKIMDNFSTLIDPWIWFGKQHWTWVVKIQYGGGMNDCEFHRPINISLEVLTKFLLESQWSMVTEADSQFVQTACIKSRQDLNRRPRNVKRSLNHCANQPLYWWCISYNYNNRLPSPPHTTRRTALV